MDSINFSNPVLLTVGGIALLLLLLFWNKHNTKKTRSRNRRSFRKGYNDKKKETNS